MNVVPSVACRGRQLGARAAAPATDLDDDEARAGRVGGREADATLVVRDVEALDGGVGGAEGE